MMRLTWRQFRSQAAVAGGTLIVVAIILAITGPHLVQLYNTTVARCATHGDCSSATTGFLGNDSTLRSWLGILVVVVPGIIGIFWGAPLITRELEAGTHRLVWTQSVTRSRWLAVKLGVACLASMVFAGLLSLMVTWWASPLDRAKASIFSTFDQRDIVPIGYAAFALVLGVTFGVLIRRTLPAMASTLVVFVAALLLVAHEVRPRLITPMSQSLRLSQSTAGFGSANGGPFTIVTNPPSSGNEWFYSEQIVDKAGHTLAPSYVANSCPSLVAGAQASGGGSPGAGQSSRVPTPAGVTAQLQECFAKVGAKFHEVITFQPASRYWTFQWYELAIYFGISLILAASCIWWVRRRLV
jgi:ABC-type transport system involved in multi-copper enzyme maturation permease subunit